MSTHDFQTLVVDDAALFSVCAAFERLESIALDTEYVRERTYYPKPSLVQLSDGENHALLDIIALKDLRPLQNLLAKPKITKIIHSPEQDLSILEFIECPIENALFDTQLAAAFLGLGYMISYQDLAKKCLGIELKKGYARSNWLTRPLSGQQINYALEDVIYLPQLHQFLTEHLEKSGKLSWFEEESARILRNYYTDGFVRAIPIVSGEGKMTSVHERKRLRKLAEWREEKAKQADIPRRWLIKDKDLIDVAQNRKPLSELATLCKQKYVQEIDINIDELEKQLLSITTKAQIHNYLSKKDLLLVEKIKLLISKIATEHEMEKTLIASDKQILRFVRDKEKRGDMALSSGWRYRIIQQPIKELMGDDNG